MTSNLPSCSTFTWDSSNHHPHTVSHHRHFHHHSPQHHDANSWKTYETYQNTDDNQSYKDNLKDIDNQSKGSSTISFKNKSDSPSTVYTHGPIDGNLYATITKPKVSVAGQQPHLSSFKPQSPPPPKTQGSADMNYNESHVRSSIDSGISSVNSNNNNSRPMTNVSTFLPVSSPTINGKSNTLRQSNETNNNIILPNGYNNKLGSVVNVEAIVHHKPESMVETDYSTNPSSNYSNGKLFNNNSNNNNNFSSSSTSNTISGISEAEQAALDELLSGMLREVENFPDYPLNSTSSTIKRSTEKQTDNYSNNNNNNDNHYASINNNQVNYNYESKSISKQIERPESPPIDIVDCYPPSEEIVIPGEPVRVSSPQLPPLTDHFGKIEPLPVRFLTKAPPTSPEDERGRPYHARPGSQPFSYGVTKSSPALQRRRVVSESTAYICESRPKPDPSSPQPVSLPPFNSETKPSSPVPVPVPEQQAEPERVVTTQSPPKLNTTVNSLDETIDEHSIPTNGHPHKYLGEDVDIGSLTWLQKQQLKLKNRHEGKDLRSKDLVLAELRGTISRVDYNEPSESRSSSPLPNQIISATSSSPISRSPLALPNLSTSPIPRSPQPLKSSINLNSPTTPPPLPLQTSTPSKVSNQINSMLSNLTIDKPCQSPSIASSPTSPTYSRPLHVNTYETRTSSVSTSGITTTNNSPSTPNMYLGTKAPLNFIARQNSIPSTPPHHRYASASGSTSPLTYSQIKDNYGRTLSSPEPGRDSPSVYFGQSQRSSLLSLNESDIISQHPTFIKDTSKFWYKPTIPREDAIKILLDKPPGTFIIRDSNSFPGAFGLALKVAQPPPDVQTKSGDASHELVRHFLIEPTSKGVRIKGCPNEPVFASLPALVYQHSITPLALSCKLIIPDCDLTLSRGHSGSLLNSGLTGTLSRAAVASEAAEILAQGAACNVLYLLTVGTESLTGPLAVRNAVTELLSRTSLLDEIIVHFKVSNAGITLTDNSHRNFFRRHYPLSTISHFDVDPEGRCYKPRTSNTRTSQLFGFVARARGLNQPSNNNECHLFAEFDEDQATSAIVNFANKVILSANK